MFSCEGVAAYGRRLALVFIFFLEAWITAYWFVLMSTPRYPACFVTMLFFDKVVLTGLPSYDCYTECWFIADCGIWPDF